MELFLSIICFASFIAFIYLGFHIWKQKIEHAQFISVILILDGFSVLGSAVAHLINFLK